MEYIETVTRKGLFNITDTYKIFKDQGLYGICKEGETVTHCGYKTKEAVLRSKNMPIRTVVYL